MEFRRKQTEIEEPAKAFKLIYSSNVYEERVVQNMTQMFECLNSIIGDDVNVLYQLVRYHQNVKINKGSKEIFSVSKSYIANKVGHHQRTLNNIYKRLIDLQLIECSSKEERLQSKISLISVNYDEIYKYMQLSEKELEYLTNEVLVRGKVFKFYNILPTYYKRNEDYEEDSDKIEFKDYIDALDLIYENEKGKTFCEIIKDILRKIQEAQEDVVPELDTSELEDRVRNDLIAWTFQLRNHTADTTQIKYELVDKNFYIYVDFHRYKSRNVDVALNNLVKKGILKVKNNRYCVVETMCSNNNKHSGETPEDRAFKCLNEILKENDLTLSTPYYNKLKDYCRYLVQKHAFNKFNLRANLMSLFNVREDDKAIELINEAIRKNHNSLNYVLKDANVPVVNYDDVVQKELNVQEEKKKTTPEDYLTKEEFNKLYKGMSHDDLCNLKEKLAKENKTIVDYAKEQLGIDLLSRMNKGGN